MMILCQGREDNPIHTDAFNVLIKNLKEKNPIWGRTTLDCERVCDRQHACVNTNVPVNRMHDENNMNTP